MKSFQYLFFVFFCFQIVSGFSLNEYKSDTLYFTKDQLHQNKAIKLDSNWEFYWNDFIKPNDFSGKKYLDVVSLTSWTNYKDSTNKNLPSFGYATYKNNFTIPDDRPNVSLYIPRIIGSYKIWINGVFILETGKIGTTKATTKHRRFTKIIPLDSDINNFEIVIQVANFYNKKGGITVPVLLGNTDTLLQKKQLQIIADMVSIGSFAFIGILLLCFYILYWNKDKAVLYFSLMCIALSYHTLNDRYAPLSQVFLDINWVFLAKTEYIASYIVGFSASLFFAIILKDYVNKWYKKIVWYCTITLVVIVIVLPAPYFTELILLFLIFMIVNITYIIFTTIRAIIAKNKESALILVAIVLATIVFLTHIIFFLKENEIAIIYAKFGYILVFLFISMLLLRRFSISFHKLEQANFLAVLQKKEIANTSKELTKVNLKLEENLKTLKNNNEELEDFNHIVSHDLKTPLVSVHALASFIEEDLKDKLDKNTENHLKMMKDVISKMEASINGLLEYSKVAKGNKTKEWFSFNTIINKVIELVKHQQNLIINIPENDIKIYANKVELEHVFLNLITNSIKYNDKEKTIIDIKVTLKNNEYLFSVSDNGPGIEPIYHKQIFKIFSQLETNDKDVNSTGIGLAIVKKIISNNNGIINLKSNKGKGLTITFTWVAKVKNAY